MKNISVMNLGMIITNKCNIDCKHCMRGKKCNNSMSDEVIEATLSQLKMIQNLGICGGEPTLAIDVMEKIFNYIIKNQIIVEEVTTIINGTIYSLNFLECLDMIEKYILKYLTPRKNPASFKISYDKYHMDEIRRLKLDVEFIKNVERYKKSKHYAGIQILPQNVKLFREGNAEKLDNSLTTPLRIFPPIITHVGSKYFGIFYKEDLENGLCNIGPMITVNCDGTITDCNASIEHQNTIYNFGNVLNDSIYDVCMSMGTVVKPWKYDRAISKQLHKFYTY